MSKNAKRINCLSKTTETSPERQGNLNLAPIGDQWLKFPRDSPDPSPLKKRFQTRPFLKQLINEILRLLVVPFQARENALERNTSPISVPGLPNP